LDLRFTNLDEFFAALNERFHLNKNAAVVEVPSMVRGVLRDIVCSFQEEALPSLTTSHALAQVLNALLDVPVEDFFQGDRSSASVDDFVADLKRFEEENG
jgi:DNA-binding XRE family transcriptional regulator